MIDVLETSDYFFFNCSYFLDSVNYRRKAALYFKAWSTLVEKRCWVRWPGRGLSLRASAEMLAASLKTERAWVRVLARSQEPRTGPWPLEKVILGSGDLLR